MGNIVEVLQYMVLRYIGTTTKRGRCFSKVASEELDAKVRTNPNESRCVGTTDQEEWIMRKMMGIDITEK